MKYFRISAPDLAIDLGTANSLVHVSGKGIQLNEPTVVALKVTDGEIAAIGEKAKEMLGKTPENIVEIMPLKDGVINDYDIALLLIEHHIKSVLKGISMIQPRGIITVPSSATDVEMRAITDACLQAGLRDVYLVEESLASAVGAGLPVNKPTGNLIVNLGAGNIEIAVVSLYGIVASKTIRYGGDRLNKLISQFIKEKYTLIIGPETAENLKLKLGTLREDGQNNMMEIGGRDLYSGMPKSVDVFSSDITEALSSAFLSIIDGIREVLERTSPELSRTILKNGITLTGGTSQFDGIDSFIEDEIGIKTMLSEKPYEDAVIGAAKILKNIEMINDLRKS